LLASVLAWGQGRDYYLDNWFERDARRACGEECDEQERMKDQG
jgi:hypothetical protein